MKSSSRAWTALALTIAMTLPGAALAEAYVPGSEILGQPVKVTTNGVTNTVTLSPGGQATITSPLGRVVKAAWTAANGQLCLSSGKAQECWPHSGPFEPGQPQTLTSSCNSTSTWLAASTNASPPAQKGERGR